MELIILTGSSRGLGEAFAQQLLAPNRHIICISRHKNMKLIALASEAGIKLDNLEFDLTATEHIDALTARIFAKVKLSELTAAYLINNAGTLHPMAPLSKCDCEAIDQNIKINLTAPMLLTTNFMKWAAKAAIDKRVLNISSGAGKKPYHGWSAYCTAKAGLDHFTRCVALEQVDAEFPVKIASVSPGVIDTDMQEQIRKTSAEDFKQVGRFIDLKQSGDLLTAEAAATRLIELLMSDEFGQEPVIV
ncbi:(S)-benzoin forming benzil reductase [Paenibacillus sp. N1-5-1-14]|uniref:(S)-benzoin forming benzil reductase n=1 Tax=Paenibacillus radicibacter TaxID=2972488 RepID=UPI0021598569|nr:(S)-benzoin forming benzil reductase [Paenibacillus radicibacter]MCR8643102.1 (S)-benzoin forming benzil reductase [Paenibacillus radicibacter]